MKLHVSFTGRKVQLTEAMKEHALSEINRLERFFDEDQEVTSDVSIKLQNEMQIVELTIRFHNQVLRVESKTEDYYTSMNKAVSLMKRKLAKHADKLTGINKRVKNHEIEDLKEVRESEGPVITRYKDLREELAAMPMLTPEEACRQLELVDHDFYVFNNFETNSLSVVYRHKEENSYGVIVL